MKRLAILALIGLTFGAPVLTGCDRTVEEHTKVKESSDGTRSVEKTTVKEDINGGITKTKEKHVDEP